MTTKRKGRKPAPMSLPLRTLSKFITQRKLHHARIGKQSTVRTERTRRDVGRNRLDVEALQVGNVEDLPSEWQTLRLRMRHFPGFTKSEVQASKAGASNRVAVAALAGQVMAERTDAET